MNFLILFFSQVSVSPQAKHTNTPLETLSSLMRNAGGIFKFCKRNPKRHRTLTEDSEENFQPSGHLEGVDTTGLQPCSPHPPSLSDEPALTSDNLRYEAESPDEAALVYAAKAYGFTLLSRTPDSVSVRLPSGEVLDFEVLDTLTFDSNRKRMSVLVRHPITKEYVLYTKGADFAIMELLGTPYPGKLR